MLLYHHGYEAERYISHERLVEDSKESYYDTLRKLTKPGCDPLSLHL